MQTSIFCCLLFFVIAISAITSPSRELSLKTPFVMGQGSSRGWNYGGSAVITDEFLRLTNDVNSKSGRIWNNHRLMTSEWEVVTTFRIGGQGRLGADGMAFWYTADPIEEGNVFGAKNNWRGLMIALDTFDNDGKHDNPSVSIILGDGNVVYRPETDGKDIQIGGCQMNFRSEHQNSVLNVTYSGMAKTLKVYMDIGNTGTFGKCAEISGIDLPAGYLLGISAATGGLSDNHDVYSVYVYDRSSEAKPMGTSVPHHYSAPVNQPEAPKGSIPAANPQAQQQLAKEVEELTKKLETPIIPPIVESPKLQNPDLAELQSQLNSLRSSSNAAFNRIMESNKIFAGVISRLAANPPRDYKTEMQELAGLLQELKNLVKKIPAADNVKQLTEINENIIGVKTHLEGMVNIMETLIDKLKQSTSQTVKTIKSRTSFGFWAFFAIFQIVFAIGFFFWKKMRDEKKKMF